jgi:hypothetical protein
MARDASAGVGARGGAATMGEGERDVIRRPMDDIIESDVPGRTLLARDDGLVDAADDVAAFCSVCCRE